MAHFVVGPAQLNGAPEFGRHGFADGEPLFAQFCTVAQHGRLSFQFDDPQSFKIHRQAEGTGFHLFEFVGSVRLTCVLRPHQHHANQGAAQGHR